MGVSYGEEQLARGARAAEKLAGAPAALRSARRFAAGFEDRAVRAVAKLTGADGGAEIAGLLRRTARERGARGLSFALWDELDPLPVALRASRLRFDFSAGPTALLDGFANTPMWAAREDAREALGADERPLALVFSWPRFRGAGGLAVLHAIAPHGRGLGTRLVRWEGDERAIIEGLPSFLYARGLLAEAARSAVERREHKGRKR